MPLPVGRMMRTYRSAAWRPACLTRRSSEGVSGLSGSSVVMSVVLSVFVKVVGHVDHDRVRPEEKARLQPEGGLAVQEPLPPAVRHEGREHDGDRLVGVTC